LSEEKTNTEETESEETKTDIVGDNIGLPKSKIIAQDALILDLTEKLDEMTTKYEQAKEFMEDAAKAELVAYIAPRYDMAKELLILKSLDELKALKEHVDKIMVPVFKSGTKVSDIKKTSQRALLDSTFDRAQAKRMGGKN